MKENEELKAKIEVKEKELSQLKSKSEREVLAITNELESLDTELKIYFDSKIEAEEEIQRLEETVETCQENICRLEEEKKNKESQLERNLASLTSAQDNLTEEIEHLRASLATRMESVDGIAREGDAEPVVSEERQRFISFLTKTIEEKEAAIREKESELECPVCLETAGGEIFSCVEQHLVCSQCRPRVTVCPQCRQPYPPTPIRHRYAEKMVGELERLREELGRISGELDDNDENLTGNIFNFIIFCPTLISHLQLGGVHLRELRMRGYQMPGRSQNHHSNNLLLNLQS